VLVRRVFAVLTLALAGCGASQARSETPTPSDTGTRQVSDGPGPCGSSADKTLAADGSARIYQQGRVIYGCAGLGGRSYRLGVSQSCINSDRVAPVALAGKVAAYGVQRCGVDTGTAQVVVRRLADGKVLRAAPATSRVPGAESYQSVATVVVKADGAVAWIGQAHSILGHRAQIEVHRIDGHGAAELDSGAGIAVGSLRLHGSQLSWTHSLSERSATLS
jgi:hypothetical protein